MSTGSQIQSVVVVVSWWSNCLGLACLANLVEKTDGRAIYVVQVGKSAQQRERFRAYMPVGIGELDYSETEPAEHSRVLQEVVVRHLPNKEGIWFIDHDTLFRVEVEPWLRLCDSWFSRSGTCLCLPRCKYNHSITQPAFWISPGRWPKPIPSFDPVPFQARESSRRPDLFRYQGEMIMPVKDTLTQARDEILGTGHVITYSLQATSGNYSPLPPLPAYYHLGGLFLFAGPPLPAKYDSWMRETTRRFADFYSNCPTEWKNIEDPELLRRLEEFQGLFDVKG